MEVLKLLDAAIFNLIAGNADAHGKNFSLLHGEDGTMLAPLYDLLCTVAYHELSPKLAMKIAKCSVIEEIDDRTWDKFAAEVGLGAPFIHRRVKELAEVIISAADGVAGALVMPGLSELALKRFASLVLARARRLM